MSTQGPGERVFPIMHAGDYGSRGSTEKQLRAAGNLFAVVNIPWTLIEPHAQQAMRNHAQTLRQLAGRGGLDAREALDVIEGRGWGKCRLSEPEAHARLVSLIIAPPTSNGGDQL